jgi:hypothetical protein
MNISRGAYNILFLSLYLKVKILLKIFSREDCVNMWLLSFVLMSLLSTMWRAKKFDKSQGRYELFFTICIYDEKKQYRVTKK